MVAETQPPGDMGDRIASFASWLHQADVHETLSLDNRMHSLT